MASVLGNKDGSVGNILSHTTELHFGMQKLGWKEGGKKKEAAEIKMNKVVQQLVKATVSKAAGIEAKPAPQGIGKDTMTGYQEGSFKEM